MKGDGIVGDEVQDIFAMTFALFAQVVHGAFGDPTPPPFLPADESMGMLAFRLGKNAGVALETIEHERSPVGAEYAHHLFDRLAAAMIADPNGRKMTSYRICVSFRLL